MGKRFFNKKEFIKNFTTFIKKNIIIDDEKYLYIQMEELELQKKGLGFDVKITILVSKK